MKRIHSGIFAAIVCAAAVSVSAQSTPPPAGDQAQPSADASKKITVTGCVERAPEGGTSAGAPTGTPTGTSGAASASKFVLKNVTSASADTAGTSGSASAAIASSYNLDAEDSKLTPHVGHKIEVTGTVDEKPMGGMSRSAAAKLKVESVKMIAATCTP